jgi:hypothetical protein
VLPVAVAVGGVLLAAAPAYATVKATWSKPTDNSTYTTTAPIDFAAALDRGGSVVASPDGTAVKLNLEVPGPQPGPYTVDTSTGSTDKDVKFTFTPACANYVANPCPEGGAPAYNGRYTATMTGGATGTRTVVLQVPPAAPTGVAATAAGTHRVRVSWTANREPDTTGYDVFTADGTTVAANLPAGTTQYEFDLPSSGYGGEHSYVVRAHRLACANCTGDAGTAQLDSPMSQPATVTFTEPTPDPTPDPGSGGGDTGSGTGSTGGNNGSGGTGGYNGGTGTNGSGSGGTGTNGSGTGSTGSGTDQNGYNTGAGSGTTYGSGAKPTTDPAIALAKARMAFGLTFKTFSPKLGAPKLPPLPKFTVGETPIPEGTYDPMLEYGDQTVTVPEKIASGGGITSTLVESVQSVFEGRKLFRSIAIALLLLLAAGHLRVWLRANPEHH